ncbi:peptide chain release factor 1 [Xenorhabdus sp. SGI246]|uniref:protein RtxH n=1 Tax=Xenorhabdus sp. SGI246 TaxID=3158263 RepID=UPI00349F5AFC
MSEKFVQTISSVNYNKGVFSLYFVGQDPHQMANGVLAENDKELALKQVIHMPVSGFMYMVSMVKSMLEDPRMEAEINKLIAAGFLPMPEMNENAAPVEAEQSVKPAARNTKKSK